MEKNFPNKILRLRLAPHGYEDLLGTTLREGTPWTSKDSSTMLARRSCARTASHEHVHSNHKYPIRSLIRCVTCYELLWYVTKTLQKQLFHVKIIEHLSVCLGFNTDQCALTPELSASICTISAINDFDCYLIFWAVKCGQKPCDCWRACSTLESSSPRMSWGRAGSGGRSQPTLDCMSFWEQN